MKELHDTAVRPERAYLVGVRDEAVRSAEAESLVKELASLGETLGIEVAGSVTVPLRVKTAALLLGSGKADEIVAAAKAADADSIIFDRPISPVQQRDWEKLSGLSVYDRAELIIKIFASRAHTKEASLQVELAQLKYLLPRLSHSYEELHRQRGGRYGTKGSGEQKIELDRREISDRIQMLEEELNGIRKNRAVQRRRRERISMPRAAIVGYTNAGKSSILNVITLADVFAEDKLFATLDPTTRRLVTKAGVVLLTDTVGFVRNLPHGLVEAFKATLEEAADADLLVHVLDAADAESEVQYETTRKVLSEIGADTSHSVIVYNKVDKVVEKSVLEFLARRHPGAVFCSAKTGEGLETLKEAINAALSAGDSELLMRIPQSQYGLVSLLYREATVLSEEHEDGTVLVRGKVPQRLLSRLKDFVVAEC